MEPSPAVKRPLAEIHRLPGAAERPARTRVGLSRFDKAALTAFAGGDTAEVAELIEDARLLAEALIGEDGNEVRVRLVSRCVSAARTQQRILEALLGERLAVRDDAGVELVSKVLDGVAKRLGIFLKQLAVESSLRRRPTVVIRHADAVHVGEEKA